MDKDASRLRTELSLYRKAINKIDDCIEYSLPMPPKSKAAIYDILDDLTRALSRSDGECK